jgi:hypothetical protein
MADDRFHRCEIGGCRALSGYLVSKGFSIRNVCSRCMTEMLALYGWKLATPIREPTTPQGLSSVPSPHAV